MAVWVSLDGATSPSCAARRRRRQRVDVLRARARPGACGQRGFLGRLPLQLARLYGAAPSTLEVLTDAYPGAADCDKPAITQRTTPPRTRPSKRKGAAARRPSKRVARTVTPPDLHNVVPPFDDDYDALGLGAGCGWLDDIFDEGHAIQPSYEESLEDLGLDEVKARCAAAGLDTTVRKTDGEPGKGRFKRVLVARLLASAAAARTRARVAGRVAAGRRVRVTAPPSSCLSSPRPPAQTGLRAGL